MSHLVFTCFFFVSSAKMRRKKHTHFLIFYWTLFEYAQSGVGLTLMCVCVCHFGPTKVLTKYTRSKSHTIFNWKLNNTFNHTTAAKNDVWRRTNQSLFITYLIFCRLNWPNAVRQRQEVYCLTDLFLFHFFSHFHFCPLLPLWLLLCDLFKIKW